MLLWLLLRIEPPPLQLALAARATGRPAAGCTAGSLLGSFGRSCSIDCERCLKRFLDRELERERERERERRRLRELCRGNVPGCCGCSGCGCDSGCGCACGPIRISHAALVGPVPISAATAIPARRLGIEPARPLCFRHVLEPALAATVAIALLEEFANGPLLLLRLAIPGVWAIRLFDPSRTPFAPLRNFRPCSKPYHFRPLGSLVGGLDRQHIA